MGRDIFTLRSIVDNDGEYVHIGDLVAWLVEQGKVVNDSETHEDQVRRMERLRLARVFANPKVIEKGPV